MHAAPASANLLRSVHSATSEVTLPLPSAGTFFPGVQEDGRQRFPDFMCLQAVISETDPAWVDRLPDEISAGDLRCLGAFVVGMCERREKRGGQSARTGDTAPP